MKLVVDTSVAMKWIIDEPGSDAAYELQGHDLVAPALLRIEAANVLRALAAKGALPAEDADALFDLLQDAPWTWSILTTPSRCAPSNSP